MMKMVSLYIFARSVASLTPSKCTDIYGTSSEVKMESSIYDTISTKHVGDGDLILNLCDVVSAYGGIRSLTVGLIGDDVSNVTVAWNLD